VDWIQSSGGPHQKSSRIAANTPLETCEIVLMPIFSAFVGGAFVR
jgi:hypothetical protein